MKQQGVLSVVAQPHDKNTVDAWNEYRVQTRNLIGAKYEAIEPFVWAQLQARLGNLKVGRPSRVKVHA